MGIFYVFFNSLASRLLTVGNYVSKYHGQKKGEWEAPDCSSPLWYVEKAYELWTETHENKADSWKVETLYVKILWKVICIASINSQTELECIHSICF